MTTTREEVSSVLSFYERFCQRAERKIADHERRTAIASAEGRARIRKEREEASKRKAEEEVEQDKQARIVHYGLSVPGWDGIKDIAWTNKMDRKRTALLTLRNEPEDVITHPNKVFAQMQIVPRDGKPILFTFTDCRKWYVSQVWVRGREVEILVRR